jgi:hypothetical protein
MEKAYKSCLYDIFFLYLDIEIKTIKVMKYSEKLKASKELLTAIQSLEDNEMVKVVYGKGYQGEPNVYAIKAYASSKGVMSYSIWNDFSGMNIESLGPTTAKAYTYDMMSQRTNYTFPLYEMSIVVEIDDPLKQLEGYMGTEKGEVTK